MNIVCIRHPHYNGSGSPILTCKTCCSLYISVVKEKNYGSESAEAQANENAWLNEKKREVEQGRRSRAKSNSSTKPFSL